MGAGIPGIGISSLFYILAALWAPLRELVLTAKGRGSWERWRVALTQFALASLTLVCFFGLYVVLAYLSGLHWLDPGGVASGLRLPSTGIPNLVWGFAALAFAMTATFIYSLWARRRFPVRPNQIAASHAQGVVRHRALHAQTRRSRPRDLVQNPLLSGGCRVIGRVTKQAHLSAAVQATIAGKGAALVASSTTATSTVPCLRSMSGSAHAAVQAIGVAVPVSSSVPIAGSWTALNVQGVASFTRMARSRSPLPPQLQKFVSDVEGKFPGTSIASGANGALTNVTLAGEGMNLHGLLSTINDID
jgi:hypothetical protein